jgi:transcriptional regulator with XRE-family HTH domain
MNTRSGQIEAMKDKEYRHGMTNAQMEIDLPLQIRALRMQRGWTQPELAANAAMKQPRISNMEKPGVTHFSLETLRRLAEAFDVALVVRFAPFSELLDWSRNFSPDEFAVSSFEDEFKRLAASRQVPRRRPGNHVASFKLATSPRSAIRIRVAPAHQRSAA